MSWTKDAPIGVFSKSCAITPANIPASAHTSYKDEWKGYGDWIGTGKVRHTKFLPFKEAREYARSLNLDSVTSWNNFTKSKKRPSNIPAQPEMTYKKDWQGWGDFLGTGTIATQDREYLPPIEAKIEARKYQKKLGIKTETQWIEAHRAGKIPANLPRYPYDIYRYRRKRK